jgi:hypothetical protein
MFNERHPLDIEGSEKRKEMSYGKSPIVEMKLEDERTSNPKMLSFNLTK